MERLERLAQRVADLPREPGVYLWKDEAGQVVYVGKAIDLRSRTSSYLDPQSPKHHSLLAAAHDLDFIAVRNEKEALLLEQTLIKRHRPRFNVRLTDDKQYPYIALTNEPYPRLVKVHQHLGKGATHFGPFPDGYGAWHVLQAMNDLLPLRRCRTLPKEKCLYYDIGKCIAPCIKACTDDEYALLVQEAKDLLSGRTDHMLRRLQQGVGEAAEAQDFERAARLRDQLQGLQGVLERQHMVVERLEERDIGAIALRGDTAVAVLLHQREGKVAGQSPFVLTGVAATDEGEALAQFLKGFYQDRRVPRNLTVDMDAQRAAALEADLRLLAGRPVSVEPAQRGEKRRWLEVAATNARLRLEQEVLQQTRKGTGAVEALQKALGLTKPPAVIEGFDVSHRAGEFTRAAMVRFVDGQPDKSGYRMFGIQTVGVPAGATPRASAPQAVAPAASLQEAAAAPGSLQQAAAAPGSLQQGATPADGLQRPATQQEAPSLHAPPHARLPKGRSAKPGAREDVDDYASLHEAVYRRYRGLLDRGEPFPDLVLIDGGPGQLQAAKSAIAELGAAVPLCSLAKQEELVHVPGRMRPLRLGRNDPALQLLQRVRDEAHRFGIQQVRRKAVGDVTASPLDQVAGIGPKRRAQLVKAFAGLEGLRAASVEDLQRVPGITQAIAEQVVAALAGTP